MHAAEGILTSRGGMTSHAAVVARGWGKPCVCGCEDLAVDEKRQVRGWGGGYRGTGDGRREEAPPRKLPLAGQQFRAAAVRRPRRSSTGGAPLVE
jgi:hypothetical protein